ncbi:hypothetical protein V5O48_017663 [Marasmius crinis-equi]|uniref:GST N-terminal domain-containing protein n=1 Tax=Marasmius crinis-equi TaxID=585013 RepID=A0ABR3END8_9AGAR
MSQGWIKTEPLRAYSTVHAVQELLISRQVREFHCNPRGDRKLPAYKARPETTQIIHQSISPFSATLDLNIMITVYDMGPSKFPQEIGASPHVRKVIFTLNYKSIPYKIEPIHFDKVEAAAKSIGAPPTTTKPDGTPKWTIPFIHDSSTGKTISDSLLIAQYLDETYPDTPRVVPEGTRVLQSVFVQAVETKMYVLLPALMGKYEEYAPKELIEARKKQYGHIIAPQLTPEQVLELWNKTKATFDELDASYGENEFVTGEKPVFADLALAAQLSIVRIMFGEESKEWKVVSGWNKGRVGRLVEKALSYKQV